ncbi:MAG TPA: PEP-CTERM sorting domain-containing protein [Candidatus Acidoferrales bacterium]|nr:PEP-CTERM sorting domain-containing protein [Candidatus Acidoferrales bacterium]
MVSLIRRTILMGALACLTVCAGSASADTFNFAYSGAGITGFGTFTATNEGGGESLVTGVTGQQNGANITAMIPVGSGVYSVPDGDNFTYDNLIMIGTNPQLDLNGVLFSVQGQSQPVNIYWDTTSYYDAIYLGSAPYPNDFSLTPVQFTVTPTPESSSLLLFGFGLLGTAFIIRRKSAKPQPVSATASSGATAAQLAE